MRNTPEEITSMKPDEVFVFGSNLAGIHGAGAALLAKLKFGAVTGIGIGLQGRSYALPTKDRQIKTLPLIVIQEYVNDFISFSRRFPDMKFYVTKIGCGLAGLAIEDIAPMFRKHSIPENVWLPEEFW
jgi:hypothetical protein